MNPAVTERGRGRRNSHLRPGEAGAVIVINLVGIGDAGAMVGLPLVATIGVASRHRVHEVDADDRMIKPTVGIGVAMAQAQNNWRLTFRYVTFRHWRKHSRHARSVTEGLLV
ncbi:hypothetical protein ACQP1V_26490 [Microtetraspora malaysiensis]|uniref:hypothetical protein n=1 Tax=Microtetraspora malaysiensis TaxID=161358 RepID=UPI003D8D6B89